MLGKSMDIAKCRNTVYHSTQALLVDILRPVGLAGFMSSPILGDRIATDVVWNVWNMEACFPEVTCETNGYRHPKESRYW